MRFRKKSCAMERYSVSRGRGFDHCVITWKIENYGLAVWQRDWEVATPEFSVGEPGIRSTKWKLILQTCEQQKLPAGNGSDKESVDSRKKNELSAEDSEHKTDPVETDSKLTESESHKIEFQSRHVFLHLQRLAPDECPATVWVDWKVHCLDSRGEKCLITEKNSFFGKENGYKLKLGIIFDSEREFLYNSGVMTYFCEMIIREQNAVVDTTLHKSLDIDLCTLSEDFQWLFSQQKFCDLEIKVGERKILAHKAMLCSRSEVFENMLKKEGFEHIELTDVDYNVMVKALAYIYSGNLQDVIGKSSISIYDAIKRFKLPGLIEHYIPEEVNVYTKLDARKVIYRWVIENFSTKNNCFSSSIITSDVTNAVFQIHLYPRGVDNKSDHMAIRVEHIYGEVSDNCSVQCAVLEEDKTFYVWKTLQKSSNDERIFEDEKFMDKVAVEIINNDVLKIGFKFRLPAVVESVSLDGKTWPSIVPYTESKALEKFSEDMSTLYENRKFTDISIVVGNEKIKVHKFILYARSCTLSSMLETTNDGYLTLSGVSAEVFKILLKYMYCAVLSVYDIKMLFDVYKAAEEFGISRLGKKCSRILVNFLSVETAQDILDVAEKCHDQFLKMEALKFIRMKDANRKIFFNELKPEKSVNEQLDILLEVNNKSIKSFPETQKNGHKHNHLESNGTEIVNVSPIVKNVVRKDSDCAQKAVSVPVGVPKVSYTNGITQKESDSNGIDGVKSSEVIGTDSHASEIILESRGESPRIEPAVESLPKEPSVTKSSTEGASVVESPQKIPSVAVVESPLKEQMASKGESPPKGQSL